MSLTVVGSVALDTVETPSGKNIEGLGGAAVYFSMAASLFTRVHLVGVVGDDFPERHVKLLEGKNIDLEGLERTPGRTFRWSGRYHDDINERDTLDTQLNVFEQFHPKVPETARAAEYLFLANIHPALQLEVLDQTKPVFAGLDTMNLWINTTLDELKAVLRRVDVLIINDSEARLLTETLNLRIAAEHIKALGPGVVVIKKGEHGCILFGQEASQMFALPAYPLESVADPTGAGDTFAGGFMGYLAAQESTDFESLKNAVVHGSALASFTCEDFGPDRLCNVDTAQLEERVAAFKALTSF
ncbi:MAG TPA: PfkB family carbohydrate kinase [Candidatus Hydrogenedentes bacterium]|nr:PfkB family carbohydrate kinase [Candidatus Hydrogenedentota bacterium]